MSGPSIGAVVRCGDLIAGVYTAVASLLCGSTPAHTGAIVADGSTPPGADPWLAALATSRRWHFVRVDATGPGASWNAGLGALGPVDFAVCLDSGETLERMALETMSRRLTSDPSLAIVTSGIEWVGPGSRRTFSEPSGCSPLDILADPLALHGSSLFRWARWEATGGFDEELPALEHSDFFLRELRLGGIAVAEMAPLLRRRVHAKALYRRTWTTDAYRLAAQTLFKRHWDLVASVPGELLERKERVALGEHLRHEEGRGRSRHAEGEIERLTAGRDDRLAGVPGEWTAAVDFGTLARTSPLSHNWGYDRGTPADRPLIEQHLATHADDIRGVVLEVQENDYTRRFGGARVQRSDVLDVDVTNPRATIIGDLRAIGHVGAGTYDCIILTQTLHVIDDMQAVIRECERILKPGGILLATLPSASRVCLEYGPEADFWRATDAGARRLFTEAFPASGVETAPFGNPLVNAAFGYGLASDDLPAGAYEVQDPYYPMVIGVRARKASIGTQRAPVRCRTAGVRGVALMYHRVDARGGDPHRLSVSERTFRAQLDWLRSTCSVVPLEAFAGSTTALPERAVAVTFDDGYVDNLAVVSPLLRAAGVPATFFLTTGDGPFPYHYWWDRLAAALADATVPTSLTIDLPCGRRRLPTATDSDRRAAHWVIYNEIVRLPVASRESIVDKVTMWGGGPRLDASDRRMTWAEVRELTAEPKHSIGAHTVEHLFLPAQPDDVVMKELVECRSTLERLTGASVETLAYPFGAFDERTVDVARDAGFQVAVTCADGAIVPTNDRLALPRIEVVEESLDRFTARVERALDV